METILHRQLKLLYGAEDASTEVQVDGYRIDAVARGELIEIQQASLAALRQKVIALTAQHTVRVVKPVIHRVRIVREGQAGAGRFSPKTGCFLDAFEDLVHFVRVFPRRGLLLELLLVDVVEVRQELPTRRRRRRDRVAARSLLAVVDRRTLKTAADLLALIDSPLPDPFTTADLARGLGIGRWEAQKIAYCLRETGAVEAVGKSRNTWLYSPARSRPVRRKTVLPKTVLPKGSVTPQPSEVGDLPRAKARRKRA